MGCGYLGLGGCGFRIRYLGVNGVGSELSQALRGACYQGLLWGCTYGIGFRVSGSKLVGLELGAGGLGFMTL